jgi:hypothetical protein
MPSPPPTDWKPKHDLLLIMGLGAEQTVAQHLNNGLHRVVAIIPEGTAHTQAPNVTVLRAQAEIKSFIWSNNTPIQRISLRMTPDSGITQDIAKAWLKIFAEIAEAHRSFHATMSNLGPLWALNGMNNVRAVAQNPMIGDYKHTFAGVPMIVVGAGPSLARNLDVLKHAQGRAIVIGIHRTLQSLHRANITADITIAVEPRNVRHQYENVGLEKLAASILATTVHPNLHTTQAKRVIHYTSQGREEWLLAPQDRHHAALSLGTVSHAAVSLGRAWGCDPIILIGHDLAFPGGAVYHADGADGATTVVQAQGQWRMTATSAERKATLAGSGTENFDMMDIEAYNGGTVMTSTSFNNFRLTLEKMAVDWAGDVKLINATEGGAKIKGWRQAPLREVLASLADIDLNVDARLAAQNTNLIQAERGARINARMQTLCAQLQDVVSLSQRCLRQIDQCIRKPNPKAMAKLEKTEAAFKAASKGIAPLTLATQTDLTLIINRTQEVSDLKSALSLSRSLYALIGDAAKRLLGAAPPECVR